MNPDDFESYAEYDKKIAELQGIDYGIFIALGCMTVGVIIFILELT